MLLEADCPIWLDTGPEPIAGSTRMKAGTAQRVALNLLSSLAMIRLGHVHEGLMVDVKATNAKLARRSESILRRLTGCGDGEVADALRRANGNVKLAVLLLQGCGLDEAATVLDRAGGRLRVALKNIGRHDAAAAAPDMLTIIEELPAAVDRDE
jgi:N-acetylmuramic acid 6-phosphate etherase